MGNIVKVFTIPSQNFTAHLSRQAQNACRPASRSGSRPPAGHCRSRVRGGVPRPVARLRRTTPTRGATMDDQGNPSLWIRTSPEVTFPTAPAWPPCRRGRGRRWDHRAHHRCAVEERGASVAVLTTAKVTDLHRCWTVVVRRRPGCTGTPTRRRSRRCIAGRQPPHRLRLRAARGLLLTLDDARRANNEAEVEAARRLGLPPATQPAIHRVHAAR